MSGSPLSPRFRTVALQRSKSSAYVHSGGRIERPGTCAFNIHSHSLTLSPILKQPFDTTKVRVVGGAVTSGAGISAAFVCNSSSKQQIYPVSIQSDFLAGEVSNHLGLSPVLKFPLGHKYAFKVNLNKWIEMSTHLLHTWR